MYVAMPGLAWYGYGTCVRLVQSREAYANTLLSRWHVHRRTTRVGVGTLAMLPPYVLHKQTLVCARAISERLPPYRPTA